MDFDVVIIGGGQAGLATAYFMRRTDFSYIVLDDQPNSGGAWQHTWDSLRLFSPVDYSSIAGWQMPKGAHEYPGKDEFIDYLAAYEARYQLPVERPVRVERVSRVQDHFVIATDKGEYRARAVVSATGTAQKPFVPAYQGRDLFNGVQMHSVNYRSVESLADKTVAIVGAGNSAAQILAEVSEVANTVWVTPEEPTYNPDDVDGRHIFGVATQKFQEKQSGTKPKTDTSRFSLGSIVMVESVRKARARGDVLHAVRPFERLTERGAVWADGTVRDLDAIIWCTGFRANLDHLSSLLTVTEDGKAITEDTRSLEVPGLWLVGYGGWTGYASATIYGVTKTARDAVKQISKSLVTPHTQQRL